MDDNNLQKVMDFLVKAQWTPTWETPGGGAVEDCQIRANADGSTVEAFYAGKYAGRSEMAHEIYQMLIKMCF